MQRYQWPGNVRELENAIERAVVLCRRPMIDVEDLPETVLAALADVGGLRSPAMTAGGELLPDKPMALEAALAMPERRIIEIALKRNNWNRQATAAELAINRTTLYKKMRKHRLDGRDTDYG
jgi:DNA-binding NtrC family response regulator